MRDSKPIAVGLACIAVAMAGWVASAQPRAPGAPGASASQPASIVALPFTRPTTQPAMLVLSLRDYQVVQRSSRSRGTLPIRGRVAPAFDAMEVRISGRTLDGSAAKEQWQRVESGAAPPAFSGELMVPAGGWYQVDLRALRGGRNVASARIEHVGVGEVFVIAGQSNSTNYGEVKTSPQSGLVSTFDGSGWRLADDPQPGTHDKSTKGSPWPAFGDALAAKYHVPIGIASTGHGGTSVRAWATDGPLFQWMENRIVQLGPGGFRAVLWHQGESDGHQKPPREDTLGDEYTNRMIAIIRASKEQAGWEFPWFVAQVSYHSPEDPSVPEVRAAQKELWTRGEALEGPDTDTLTGDNRQNGGKGIHLSEKGLKAHGEMWAEKVGAYLDQVLKE